MTKSIPSEVFPRPFLKLVMLNLKFLTQFLKVFRVHQVEQRKRDLSEKEAESNTVKERRRRRGSTKSAVQRPHKARTRFSRYYSDLYLNLLTIYASYCHTSLPSSVK